MKNLEEDTWQLPAQVTGIQNYQRILKSKSNFHYLNEIEIRAHA